MADHRTSLLLLAIALLLAVIAASTGLFDRLSTLFERPDRSIAYRSVAGHDLQLQVFDAHGPAPATGFPALMLFHGGAWELGSPAQFHPQCRYFAGRGLSCISVQYRLQARDGTDARAAVHDARAAFAHVRAHARELGIDPARIAVGGGSAGGHLAATLGVPVPLAADDLAPRDAARPAAMVLYNPMLDLAPGKPDHERVAPFWREISPMQQVDAAVPPTLILLGTEDPEVPVPTAQAFCDAIVRQGGRCELALYAGATHGFFNIRDGDRHHFDATNARIDTFLRAIGVLGK